MAVLHHNALVVDAHFGEVSGPCAQGVAVGDGKGQVIQKFVGRCGRSVVRNSTGGEHNHHPGVTVFEGDVSDVEIFGKGDQTERRSIPPSTGSHVSHQQLEMGEPGDRRPPS